MYSVTVSLFLHLTENNGSLIQTIHPMVTNIQNIVLRMEKKIGSLEREVDNIYTKLSNLSEKDETEGRRERSDPGYKPDQSHALDVKDNILTSFDNLARSVAHTNERVETLTEKVSEIDRGNKSLSLQIDRGNEQIEEKLARLTLVNCHSNVVIKEGLGTVTSGVTSELQKTLKKQTKTLMAGNRRLTDSVAVLTELAATQQTHSDVVIMREDKEKVKDKVKDKDKEKDKDNVADVQRTSVPCGICKYRVKYVDFLFC